MSERVDRFCDNLRDRLNAVEEHLDHIKQRLDTSKRESRAAIEAKVSLPKLFCTRTIPALMALDTSGATSQAPSPRHSCSS